MHVTHYVGIDIGSEAHVLAALDAQGDVVQRPVRLSEDAAGYAQLDAVLAVLGTPAAALVVCEATGH